MTRREAIVLAMFLAACVIAWQSSDYDDCPGDEPCDVAALPELSPLPKATIKVVPCQPGWFACTR